MHRNNYLESPKGFFEGAPKEHLDQYKWLTGDKGLISIKDITKISKTDFKDEIEVAVKDIESKGYNVLAYDLTHPKLNIPVVRVLIPGLQPNFLVKGLHYLDPRSCVTPHLKIHGEVMERLRRRELPNQKLDEVVDIK